MNYLQELVKTLAEDITRHRRYNYSHDALEEYLLAHPEIGCATFKVLNSREQHLDTLLLRTKKAKGCIVYAHGLGSNKLQALALARFFPKFGYDICSFDFSSSGRSEGSYTTYGLLEQEDINSILSHLQSRHSYDHYVLWGRSMGSVSIMLSQGRSSHPKVSCLVLDSPFSSFEKVSIEIASKKSFIPQFMLGLLIQPLKTYFASEHPFNPFNLDIIEGVKKIDLKILLIYSQNDSVVSYTHSLQIAKHCKRTPIELEIKQDHNMQRSRQTHVDVLKFMERCEGQVTRRAYASRSRARGISVTSKEGKDKECSIRSSSKLKLVLTESFGNGYESCGRSIKTIGGINKSIQYSKRFDTDVSPSCKRKIGAISSLCMDEKLARNSNKENMKPRLNMMRKNRFR